MKSKISNANKRKAGHVLELYRSGNTLSEIGEIFGFTRSRAQQILIKELGGDILKRQSADSSGSEKNILLNLAVKKELQEIYNNRKANKEQGIINRILEKMKKAPDRNVFSSVNEYVRAIGEDFSVFSKYFSDITTSMIQEKKKIWSLHYAKCRVCGTTAIKHRSHGLCKNCYYKSDIFKEMQISSRLRNSDKRKAAQTAYALEYAKRPEVVEKLRKRRDLEKYGGNREKAIERDGLKCVQCGLTKEESSKKYGRDLYVVHLNDTKNNELENLLTICYKCHNKRSIKRMHEAISSNT